MAHEIPQAVTNAVFSLLMAGGTWVIGKRKGRIEGAEEVHANFVNAIQGAASVVIERLEALVSSTEAREAECIKALAEVTAKQNSYEAHQADLRAQIEAIMAGPVAGYTFGDER